MYSGENFSVITSGTAAGPRAPSGHVAWLRNHGEAFIFMSLYLCLVTVPTRALYHLINKWATRKRKKDRIQSETSTAQVCLSSTF